MFRFKIKCTHFLGMIYFFMFLSLVLYVQHVTFSSSTTFEYLWCWMLKRDVLPTVVFFNRRVMVFDEN